MERRNARASRIKQAVTVAIMTTLIVSPITYKTAKDITNSIASSKFKTENDTLKRELSATVESLNKANNEITTLEESVTSLTNEIEELKYVKEESEQMALDTVPHPELRQIIIQAAIENDLPIELIVAVGHIESQWDCTLIGPAQDSGCMQIIPSTGKWAFENMPDPGDKDLMNPVTNIRAGAWLLKAYIDAEHGDVARGLAMYNGGTDAWNRKPETTRGYAARVLSRTVIPCQSDCK